MWNPYLAEEIGSKLFWKIFEPHRMHKEVKEVKIDTDVEKF
jgi:hypothetical protein